MSETHCLCEKCRNLMPTDNPSSGPSKGPTQGEEIALNSWDPRDGRLVLARLIDAALASQEARHQQEMEQAIGVAFGFSHSKHCPLTHEPTGAKIECLSCQRSKAEQELAEAKRDHHAGVNWPDCPGCLRYYRQDEEWAMENARLTQQLGGAEAREKVLREALVHIQGCDDCHECVTAGPLILAALRSGPQEQTDAEPENPYDDPRVPLPVAPLCSSASEPPSRPGGSRE